MKAKDRKIKDGFDLVDDSGRYTIHCSICGRDVPEELFDGHLEACKIKNPPPETMDVWTEEEE